MEKTYNDAVKLLTSAGKFRISLGLERISKILELLGNPQDKLRCIHVAGTNGKGSVCSILSSILTVAKVSVGLFTSPHIYKYINLNLIEKTNGGYKLTIQGILVSNVVLADFIE